MILTLRFRHYVIQLLLLFLLSGAMASPAQLQLTQDDCGTCTGHTLVYECTAVGIGSTVWRGSAISSQCTSRSIILSHSLYSRPSGTDNNCNNEEIIGYSVRAGANNSYTSRLNITVRESMDEQTVSCFYNDGAREIEIGEQTINIIQDPLPPPGEIQVASIDVTDQGLQVMFNWTTTWQNCPALQYGVTSIRCGVCLSPVNGSQASCRDAPVGGICSFAVHTVTCGTIVEDPPNSASLAATLKVPSHPSVQCVPLYSADRGELKAITTTFEEAESFTISGDFDGSATSYTISYADASSGSICASVTFPPSNCNEGTCSHAFQIADSACPPCVDINITVYATNLLGNGAPSETIKISNTNLFVEVRYNALSSTVQCTFMQQTDNTKTCSIAHAPDANCSSIDHTQTLSGEISRETEGDLDSITVNVPLNRRSLNGSKLCLIAMATDGANTARVEGIFNAGCNPQQLTDFNGTASQSNAECGPPMRSLGIENGLVCYSSVDTGATAVYYCASCDHSTIGRISVRTCLADGTWNGTIPNCECSPTLASSSSSSKENSPVFIATIATATLSLAFLVIVCILTTAVVVLAKSRLATRTELKRLQANANVFYEEIALPPPIIKAATNVAYESVTAQS